MFQSCQNPIVRYSGSYFKNEDNRLELRCFDPNTWRNFISSPGKLKQMIRTCEAAPHNCVKSSQERTYPDNGLPKFRDLTPRTSFFFYNWFEQFKATKRVLGFQRCDRSLTRPITTFANRTCRAFTQSELFDDDDDDERDNRGNDDRDNRGDNRGRGTGVSRMKRESDAVRNCPPRSPDRPCDDFMGEEVMFSPVNSTMPLPQRRQLALAVEVNVPVDIQVQCVPDAVKIIDNCLV